VVVGLAAYSIMTIESGPFPSATWTGRCRCGLARPLRALVPTSEPSRLPAPEPGGPVLVVVGSYADQARAQRDELVRAGFGEVFSTRPTSRP
jgi:hypothetical protein